MNSKRELLAEMGYDDMVLLEPQFLDEAIEGVSHDGRAIYNYDKLIKAFMDGDGMTEEDAIDWISYNTIRSLPYVEKSPIILFGIED